MNNTKKSSKNRILEFISALIMILTIAVVGSILINITKDGVPRIFGYSFHVVLTGSMEPEINVDDVAIAKHVKKSTIKVGDDIVFRSKDPALAGMLIVHRVIEIDQNGNFITQGIKQGASVDKYPVEDVVGKVSFVSPTLGKLLTVVINYRPLIFAIFIVGIGVLVLNTIKTSILKADPTTADTESIRGKVIDDIKQELMQEIISDLKEKQKNNDN